MNLFVIGGTRFIGRAVVERAVELGHKVAVYHRGESEPEGLPDVPHIHGDHLDIHDHIDQIREFAPDAAVDTTQGTAAGTQSVVDALTGLVSRYVLVSSKDVYLAYGRLHRTEPGPLVKSPIDEHSPLRTKPGFGHTDEIDNLHIERVALGQNDLSTTITRLPGVFGPFDYQRRVGEMIDRLINSEDELRLHPLRANFLWTWVTSRILRICCWNVQAT